MSIYASLPGISPDDPTGPPWTYQGSHILPADDHPRGGEIGLALIPSHITRDRRDNNPEDGRPWPWLRLSLDISTWTEEPAVVLDRPQVAHLIGQLTAWYQQTGDDVTEEEALTLDLADGPARCPLCPGALTLHTLSGARAHVTAVHPEQHISGPGPWSLRRIDDAVASSSATPEPECGEECAEGHVYTGRCAARVCTPCPTCDHTLDADGACPTCGTDELTAEEARDLADDLGTQLYKAEDALAFVGECCDIADREGRQPTTAQVREWLKGARCGRQLLADRAADPAPEADRA